MGKALHQLSKSPFTHKVEKGKLPRHFTQPNFTIYNGRTDPIEHEWRDFRSERYNNKWSRRDFAGQSVSAPSQVVNAVFREPVQQVLEKIHHEPYFRWPSKMVGDPMKRNQNLHCNYHQEKGHTTENCRNLWNYLDQLIKEGKLRQFLNRPNGQGDHAGLVNQGSNTLRPPLGTINVIFAALGRTGSCPTRVLLVSQLLAEETNFEPKRVKGNPPPILGFSEDDKVGTIQPHDDALVITLRIGGYDVKRVMVDQGSGADIMYPDLFKGLKLKLEDLTTYDSPLISFEGKVVIPKGQIRLPVQSSPVVVNVDFILVEAYSPYTAIVARPWLHALGAVSSTLHVKVKFPFGEQIEEIVGSQFAATQCIIAAIIHQTEQESLASAGECL
ncbi:uncharacterized protein LOC142644384 [Castanea sativa]|uniref:uncharacterized protein LOC142644384 n=1 Tax=Castanea sativa TaxID=21020 RepID=UPI003F64D2C7